MLYKRFVQLFRLLVDNMIIYHSFIVKICFELFDKLRFPTLYRQSDFDTNVIDNLNPIQRIIFTVIRINILNNYITDDFTFTRVIRALKYLIKYYNDRLLEIGSQDRSEVKSAFNMCKIETLDLVPDYNPDIIGDITKHNPHIEDSTYEYIKQNE
jgi:hypothetical protein